jgi:hypothetical protein
MTEISWNGIDDDCNPATSAYPTSANRITESFCNSSLVGSGVFNEFALLLVPVGTIILQRG